MLGPREKQILATDLITGLKNINTYTNGVCYDTVAFVRYLLDANISPNELLNYTGMAWKSKFQFEHGRNWDGRSPIPAGTAVGFYRLVDNTVFHAALAIGGTEIRAVNGNQLGVGWQRVDLKTALGAPNRDGSFNYDRTKIFVYLSNL